MDEGFQVLCRACIVHSKLLALPDFEDLLRLLISVQGLGISCKPAHKLKKFEQPALVIKIPGKFGRMQQTS